MKELEAKSYPISIYIAGDYDLARRLCLSFCTHHGFCVTVERVQYLYTGGEEAGVRVGVINYPRFPSTPEQLLAKAEQLGRQLLVGMFQHSFTIETQEKTLWFSRRPEDTPTNDH